MRFIFYFFFPLLTLQQAPPNGGTVTAPPLTTNGTTGGGNGTTGGGGTGNGTIPNTPSGNRTAACDPFFTVCPEYVSGAATCEPISTAGQQMLVISPNKTAFFYVGERINVTFSFTAQTSNLYPRSYIAYYYRQIGTENWVFWGNLTQGNLTTTTTIQNVSPGSYEILALPDGVDATQRYKVGRPTSCTPDGWPYSSPQSFRLLQRSNIVPAPNYFGPNSAASSPLQNSKHWSISAVQLLPFLFFI